MSKILCIIDGMTDAGFRMEDYPNMGSFSINRYIDTTRGAEPESLGCILRILGIHKVPPFLRGYAEALGNDIPVSANDLILRGTWMALDEQGRCTVPVAAPQELKWKGDCKFYPLGDYRSLLIFPGMASFVSDITTFPPYSCAGQLATASCPQGCKQLEELFNAQLTLDRCLIPWGQSVSRVLPPFPQKAAAVCGTPIVKGIAKMLDMAVVSAPSFTGDVDTDLVQKAISALNAAKEFPFVLLHINGADEAAHRKNPAQKRAFLQKVDEVLIPMLKRSWHDIYLVADHGTDPKSGQHLGGLQVVYSNAVNPLASKEKKKSASPEQDETVIQQRKEFAVRLLCRKASELGQTPRKSDFSPEDIIRIKGALGPWPRALEAAGLKLPKEKK